MKCGNPEQESSRRLESGEREIGVAGSLRRTEEQKQLMCVAFSSNYSRDRETKEDYSFVRTLDSLT